MRDERAELRRAHGVARRHIVVWDGRAVALLTGEDHHGWYVVWPIPSVEGEQPLGVRHERRFSKAKRWALTHAERIAGWLDEA